MAAFSSKHSNGSKLGWQNSGQAQIETVLETFLTSNGFEIASTSLVLCAASCRHNVQKIVYTCDC